MRATVFSSIVLSVLALFGPSSAADTTPSPPQTTDRFRTLHEGSGFRPPASLDIWKQRQGELRTQVLLAAGLWPLPAKTPLNAVIHGKIDRPDYTVEKVYFESYPGFYVTGNLYRPKGKNGPFPAILSPHGHWNNGRLYEAPDKEVQHQLAGGWETDPAAARFPMQARCANLASMGCIVFFYDMVGYADADPEQFPHRATFRDFDSDVRGLSVFGLQTWDSIRALDFLESLPDVDRHRLACTGASGGATQTIMMMAIDDRLSAAAPVCMISAGEHQGGCVCENNSMLRVATDNVELAATFAPRPFIHPTATGDWTHEFLEHGFPEIQATYKLFNAQQNAESFRQNSGHNYNQKSREGVYAFFNKHFQLGLTGEIHERHFDPVPPNNLHVWDAQHPRPKESVNAPQLKNEWIAMMGKQIESLKPRDQAGLDKMRSVLQPALQTIIGVSPTSQNSSPFTFDQDAHLGESKEVIARFSVAAHPATITGIAFFPRNGQSAADPTKLLRDAKTVVVLVTSQGTKDATDPTSDTGKTVARLVAAGQTVLIPDLFGVGDRAGAARPNDSTVEFFAGYNRTMLARRVGDLANVIRAASTNNHQPVDLIGTGDAGLWCLLARSLAPQPSGSRTIADVNHFDFENVKSVTDSNYLPFALRYGGLWPLAAIAPASQLTLYNLEAEKKPDWLAAAFNAAGEEKLLHIQKSMNPQELVEALRR
jgi:dienelactone hydrolase